MPLKCVKVNPDGAAASVNQGWSFFGGRSSLVAARWRHPQASAASVSAAARARRRLIYFADGLPNLVASIATLVLTSLSFAVYRPSSHVNLYSNGNLIPPTSR